MKNASKGRGHNHSNKKSDERRDRKSGTGMSGSPKKQGHGGKYTWNGDGYSVEEMMGVYKDDVGVKKTNTEEIESS